MRFLHISDLHFGKSLHEISLAEDDQKELKNKLIEKARELQVQAVVIAGDIYDRSNVSLSLALGLSDVVQSHSGGISIDTMFIDEGFGTLDNSRLDETIKVLENLADRKRQIGIISHVDKLESAISKQIIVRKYNSKDENKGSYIEQIIR